MIISLYILTLLWIISVFSFAGFRVTSIGKKAGSFNLHKDWLCLAYLRLSGVVILIVIISLVSRT